MSGPSWRRCLSGTHGFGPQASRRIRRQADCPRRTARTRLYLEPLETRLVPSSLTFTGSGLAPDGATNSAQAIFDLRGQLSRLR